MKNIRTLGLYKLPLHVAIIMDGNGRWAKKKELPRIAGHREGIKRAKEIVEVSREIGIKVITLYTFSYENWQRPQEEIAVLMQLLKNYLEGEWENLVKQDIRLIAIGDLKLLPPDTYEVLQKVIKNTAKCQTMILNLAISYGGRQEIIHAVKVLIENVKQGNIKSDEINEVIFSQYLWTKGLPDPDFIIRTSGEFRLSNFLLWQSAYAEFYITPILWPDFNRFQFIEALKEYQRRERRFGKISEQFREKDRK
ncbi:UDP pyrophosphate synthase [Candidatus Desulfofervidus auxilii]|uniref:Isoprenyl transferase n=2 Tax=Desulfofervidus auxilii TaxID=1621989 RepID=A0A7U4QKG8_DESA2|nr:isoprenyl transferase [Candidatus Desulfofervidus auxilii]AMM41006.1 UDP pyrophosphate synthase [Candidatus Desulfofervidus auxilii]CAD7775998.1 Isoprenyl transferase [Candidatus Methanoperedenaceae archaeon GB50]